MKNNRPRFDEALKKQEELQKKKNEVKMGNKTPGPKKQLIILKSFTILKNKLLTVLEVMLK